MVSHGAPHVLTSLDMPKDQLPREMSPGGSGQRMAGTDEVPGLSISFFSGNDGVQLKKWEFTMTTGGRWLGKA